MPAFAATSAVVAVAGGAAGAVSPISVRSTSCTLTPAAPASCCPPSTFTLPPPSPPSRFIVTAALPSVFFFTFVLPLSAVLSALLNEAASCVAFC